MKAQTLKGSKSDLKFFRPQSDTAHGPCPAATAPRTSAARCHAIITWHVTLSRGVTVTRASTDGRVMPAIATNRWDYLYEQIFPKTFWQCTVLLWLFKRSLETICISVFSLACTPRAPACTQTPVTPCPPPPPPSPSAPGCPRAWWLMIINR